MQDKPIVGSADDAFRSLGAADRVQRWLLFELVTAASDNGEDIAWLARKLREPRIEVEAAAAALVRYGLAERHGGAVLATPAAKRFEALWPIRL
jgi:hypothetical protein